jgi:DNA-binding response OmpR family regulator
MGSRVGVLTGMYIVVVEDDRDSRDILRMLLEYFGANVTAVPSAREGLSVLTTIDPSVVITDMLKSDGMDLFLKARRRGLVAPFIAVSGKDFDAAVLEDQGFAAYLRKPLDHNVLVTTILGAMRSR